MPAGTSWTEMTNSASAFAKKVGREDLISISHPADSCQGAIVVWYWGPAGS
jgi:hypothetical protein